MAMTFLMGVFLMGATSGDELVAGASELLGKKETVFPYYAEYELGFPAAPTPIGRATTVRFYARDARMLYSEELMEHWSSRVLIRNGTVYWEYEDDDSHQFFMAPAPLGDATPTEFLQEHEFAANVFTYVDASLIGQLEDWARSGKVHCEENQYIVDVAQLGSVRIRTTESSLTIAAGQKEERSLLRYHYGEGRKPPWADEAMASFLRRFRQAAEESITVLESEESFQFAALMNASVEEGRPRPIPLERLDETAAEHRYYLPRLGKVLSAQGVVAKRRQKSLELEVRHAGKEYEVVQRIPPIARETLLDTFIVRERRAGPYAVIHWRHPEIDPPWDLTHYLSKEVSFFVPGNHFEDKAAEQLIRSFRRAKSP